MLSSNIFKQIPFCQNKLRKPQLQEVQEIYHQKWMKFHKETLNHVAVHEKRSIDIWYLLRAIDTEHVFIILR